MAALTQQLILFILLFNLKRPLKAQVDCPVNIGDLRVWVFRHYRLICEILKKFENTFFGFFWWAIYEPFWESSRVLQPLYLPFRNRFTIFKKIINHFLTFQKRHFSDNFHQFILITVGSGLGLILAFFNSKAYDKKAIFDLAQLTFFVYLNIHRRKSIIIKFFCKRIDFSSSMSHPVLKNIPKVWIFNGNWCISGKFSDCAAIRFAFCTSGTSSKL